MALKSLAKNNLYVLKQSYSTLSKVPINQSHYRRRIALANLLQRYGFPSSTLHEFISRNHFLLNSDLNEIERSMGLLLSLKIPQKSLVSLVCDCPGVLQSDFLSSWESGVSEITKSGVSSSAIPGVLEYSGRFQIRPERVLESLTVLKGLGFSDCAVSVIVGAFPKVITMKPSEIQRKIDFLAGIGVPNDHVERFFYVFPDILGLGIENRLRPLLEEFRDLGFSVDDIQKEIAREPRGLGMEVGELSRCLHLLKTLKCRDAIKDRIFSCGAFRAGFEVKLRVDCLCKHGLIRRDAFKILWKEPRAILYDIEDIDRKIEFLVNRIRLNADCLTEVPEYLGVNFEKQIVPRYNVIEYLRSKGGLGCDVGLRSLIKLSRIRFHNLYVKPYPECERLYERRVGNLHVRARNVAGLWKLFKPTSYPQTEEDKENIKAFVQPPV